MVTKPTYEELEQRIKELEHEAIKHRKIELSLTENRELFREMFEQSPIGIELYDSDGKLLKINKSCLEIFGVIDEKELKVFDLFDDPNVTDEVKEKLQNGESVRYETAFDFDKINELPLYRTTKSGILHLDVVIVALQLHDNRSSVGYLVKVQDNTKRKQAEDALRENEERYRALSNASFEAIFISENGICIDTNQKATEMLGYEFEEIIGTFGTDFIAPESKELAKQNMLSGYEEPYEAIMQRKDGSTFYTEIRGKMMDFKGRRVRVAVVHDIDRQKQAEKRLLFNENIIKSSSSSIAACDLDGKMSYANPTFLKKWGFTDPAEFLGRPFWNLWAVKPILDEVMQALKDEGIWFGDLQAIRKDGTFFDVEISAAKVFDSKGNLVALTFTSIDITERKQAEQALKNFACAVKASSDAIGMSTTEGKHYYQNKTFTDLFGDIGTDPPASLYVDENFGREVFTSIMAGNPYSGEVEMYGRDRNILFILLRAYPVKDKHGKISALVGIHTDITDRKKAEAYLQEAKKQLEKKVKERTAEINEKNIALRVLLDQHLDARKKLEESIMCNVEKLLKPNLTRLKKSALSNKQQTILNVLESNLNEIITPFLNNVSSSYMKLTPTEIQVANYIKQGATSKEIAESIGLSQRTVDTHRYKIRQKLKINGKKINLGTYLSSLHNT